MDTHAHTIEVAAGILRDSGGRILVSQRPAGSHLEALWEFPGGKLEPGEAPVAGLARELDEELGIRAREVRPLMSVTHAYPEKTVRLWLLDVARYTGTARGREGQQLRWLALDELTGIDMPAADRPAVRMLGCSPYYVISADPADFSRPAAFRERWKRCLDRGAGLLRLRTRDPDRPGLEALIEACAGLAREYGARWLWTGSRDEALRFGADGLHLSSRQLGDLTRRPLPADRLIGVSCHSLDEIRRAAVIGADFITLSPVAATSSHPEAEPLGWKRFGDLVAASPLPVYALGGVAPGDLPRARALGAFGVAGISAFGWACR